MTDRVEVTDAATKVILQLREQYGPLMFLQSGGCCDGSSPMCFPVGEFLIDQYNVLLG